MGYHVCLTQNCFTHCHCCNFLASLQFAHRIYQGLKKMKPSQLGGSIILMLVYINICKFYVLDTKYLFYLLKTEYCWTIFRHFLGFSNFLLFIFPWSTICPFSLTRSSCVLFRQIELHALLPFRGRILH